MVSQGIICELDLKEEQELASCHSSIKPTKNIIFFLSFTNSQNREQGREKAVGKGCRG
jgi:hypothetical protein